MAIQHNSPRLVLCFLTLLLNVGCISWTISGPIGQGMQGRPGKWEGASIDLSRISEIVVGETTRDQIEEMFGIDPEQQQRKGKDVSSAAAYTYSLSRTYLRSPHSFSPTVGTFELRSLLMVWFDGDVVRDFRGPVDGAAEAIEDARRERRATDQNQ